MGRRGSYAVDPKPGKGSFTLAIRIPAYAKDAKILLNGTAPDNTRMEEGYLYITREWQRGDRIDISFAMPVRRIYCNTKVRDNENCVALMRGPIVYCFEGVDNGADLQELRLLKEGEITAGICTEGVLSGMVLLKAKGGRMVTGKELYSENRPAFEPQELTAVPYFAWGNRGENQMRVWMPEA